jgi:hypothetical protein
MSCIEVLTSGYIVGRQPEKGKGKGRNLLGGDYGGDHPQLSTVELILQLCTIEPSCLAMDNHLPGCQNSSHGCSQRTPSNIMDLNLP